jgi:hypothetical protein
MSTMMMMMQMSMFIVFPILYNGKDRGFVPQNLPIDFLDLSAHKNSLDSFSHLDHWCMTRMYDEIQSE